MAEIALRVEVVPYPLLERLDVGEAAVANPLPHEGGAELDAERAARRRDQRHFPEIVAECREQLLRHPGGAQQPVIEKMVHRVAGCLLAGALGVALLPLMRGQAILCMLALSVGVWTGCHVQTGREGASYVGRQFTIAFIMVFVQDHHWSADPIPALMRLSGILTGIVVLAAVILVTSRLHLPPSLNDANR